MDDVGVVELSHDGRLPQEVPPLLLRVPCLQRLDGDLDVTLPRQPERSAAHLPKLSCRQTDRRTPRRHDLISATSTLKPQLKPQAALTRSDDPLDGDEGDVDLLGELVHRLVGVLVGQRVDVGAHPRELDCRHTCTPSLAFRYGALLLRRKSLDE